MIIIYYNRDKDRWIQDIIFSELKEYSWLKKHGWYYHHISLNDGFSNHHTHGLPINFAHPDLFLYADITPELAQQFFAMIVYRIKREEIFLPDGVYMGDGFFERIRFATKTTQESERNVLQLILPDRNGVLPGEYGCEVSCKQQLEFQNQLYSSENTRSRLEWFLDKYKHIN